jgi:hypothetical protein
VGAALDVSDALDHAAPIEQHAAARAYVGAALDASAALDHAESTRPSSNTPLLVPTWAPRSTAGLGALDQRERRSTPTGGHRPLL